MSLLPAGALTGLIPRFRNPFNRGRRHRRNRYHNEPYYHDYDNYEDYNEYDYYPVSPPRDHNHRRLRHGPPVFRRRMDIAYSKSNAKEDKEVSKFSNDHPDTYEYITYEEPVHNSRLVKRQANQAVEPPW